MNRPLRTFISLALIAHVLAILAMAACPQWHEDVHHDADHQDHECGVTLFARGLANDAAPAPVLTTTTLVCVEVLRMEAVQEVFLARIEGRIRERAPPTAAA